MARRKKSVNKTAKKIQVKLIDREKEGGELHQTYRIMDDLIEKHHQRLTNAKIGIAWRMGWLADPDGRVELGKAKKASDLDRELHNFDFVFLLNFEVWNAAEWSAEQMTALIDHLLCHCEVSKDRAGEDKQDDRGRPVWRTRKHDVQEFKEVVARHGLWTSDLERFGAAALRKAEAPLFPRMTGTDSVATLPRQRKVKEPQHISGALPQAVDSLSMSTDGHSSTITIDKAAAQRMKKTADAIVEQEQSAQDFTEDTPHVLGVSLADLGLIGKTAEKLAENSLFTLTDLEEFDGEIASLDGVTKKMATEIGAAIKKYRAKHPLPATDDGSASIDEPETTAPGRIASASEFELDEEAIRSALHVNLLSRLQKGEIPKLDKVLAIDRRIEQLGPGWIAVPADFGTPGDYRLIPLHPRNWDAPVGKDDPFAGGLVEYAGARWALGTVAESVVVKA